MRRNQPVAAGAFLAPFAILFTTFIVVPVFFGLFISLNRWHVLDAAPTFIGGENYANALHDDLFWFALMRTGIFVLLSVPIGNAISLFFAVLLNQKFRGTTFYKVAFYLPVLLSVTAATVLWKWI
jgi:multiple sugar transport system permease protein